MSTLSNFQQNENILEQLRCTTCRGSGTVDDADLGDISFKTYACPKCHGSGWNDHIEQRELIVVS